MTNAEHERLVLLAEECGELVHIIGKVLRHGYESSDPTDPKAETNRFLVGREIADVQVAIEFLIDADDISPQHVAAMRVRKRESVKQYLHHQK